MQPNLFFTCVYMRFFAVVEIPVVYIINRSICFSLFRPTGCYVTAVVEIPVVYVINQSICLSLSRPTDCSVPAVVEIPVVYIINRSIFFISVPPYRLLCPCSG